MPPSPEPAANPGFMSRNRGVLLIAGPIVVLIGVAVFYMMGGRIASTDDAYVQAARVDISANISGRVSEVKVHDNQVVHAGDVLFTLDPRPWQIAVDDAEAQLAGARLKVQELQATYRQHLAEARSAQDTVAYEQREYERQVKLAAEGISSRAQLDQVRHDLDAARQKLASVTQEGESTLADLGGAVDTPVDSEPAVRQAQAMLDRAKLNLSYTIVQAPIDGIVAKVEQLQAGDYINAAAPLFALVSQKNIWVEANFKETDLTYMRPGQRATFTVDAFGGAKFTGRVQSTSPGTGSSFSLLPPENSSGNWVKVVQRLPVRLSIDPDQSDKPEHAGQMLASGMSVDVDVDTEHKRSLAFWK